jgi:hypothetical protein
MLFSSFADVTFELAILAVVTASLAISAAAIVPSNILVEVIAPVPIVKAPVLLIVASPLTATAAAALDALPTRIFPEVSDVPTGEAVIVAVPPKETAVPLIVTALLAS